MSSNTKHENDLFRNMTWKFQLDSSPDWEGCQPMTESRIVSNDTVASCVQVVRAMDVDNDGDVEALEVLIFFVDLLDVDCERMNEFNF